VAYFAAGAGGSGVNGSILVDLGAFRGWGKRQKPHPATGKIGINHNGCLERSSWSTEVPDVGTIGLDLRTLLTVVGSTRRSLLSLVISALLSNR
jgi:hypothetical protein